MQTFQAAILEPLPASAKYCFFHLKSDARQARERLQQLNTRNAVVGLGVQLVNALGLDVPTMHAMPDFCDTGLAIPHTPVDLVVWLRADDAGQAALAAQALIEYLAPVFELDQQIDAFLHDGGRDLTGYEDGTENPVQDDALAAAIEADGPWAGASYWVIQQWLHDMAHFQSLSGHQQNALFGRDRVSNRELGDAPASAHVKRTEQESFSPQQFVLRRSMAWQRDNHMGLVFVAFGHNFAAFEAQMARMIGREDGIVDGLFSFSRPLTGAYFWCPPVADCLLKLESNRAT